MADEIDRANDYASALNADGEQEVRYRAQRIEPGDPGDCEMCGEWSGRLVHGMCAPCRDLYRLP